jgi:ribosomal protein L44E
MHKVSILSVSHRRRKLSKGERDKTRRARGHGNLGRFSKVPISRMAMRAKITQKVQVKLTCNECKKASIRSLGRMKKAEMR